MSVKGVVLFGVVTQHGAVDAKMEWERKYPRKVWERTCRMGREKRDWSGKVGMVVRIW